LIDIDDAIDYATLILAITPYWLSHYAIIDTPHYYFDAITPLLILIRHYYWHCHYYILILLLLTLLIINIIDYIHYIIIDATPLITDIAIDIIYYYYCHYADIRH
jgi:hypothetical protein